MESATEIPKLEEVQAELARLSGYACELSDATWLARYRTSHRYANRFSQGRAFICGDAGHVHVPIGGQGMNTGIQDAFNLGWKLAGVANGDLEPSVLESYDEERRPVAESLIRGTDFAYKGILHPSEARQAATRLFGPFLVRSERVQDFVRSTLEELKIAYPGSSLNLDLGGASGPKPGERVLDAILVRDADKATVTLNDLTRTTTWTLLIFSGVHRFAGEAAERAALAADIRAAFGDRIAIYGVEADKSVPHGDRRGRDAARSPARGASALRRRQCGVLSVASRHLRRRARTAPPGRAVDRASEGDFRVSAESAAARISVTAESRRLRAGARRPAGRLGRLDSQPAAASAARQRDRADGDRAAA